MPSPGADPIRMPSSDELKRVACLAQVVGDREGLPVAVAGGLAMVLYGSPRLTKDVDVVSVRVPSPSGELTRKEPLSFGGVTFGTPMGIDLDWIVRADDYRALYEEAVEASSPGSDGFRVVPPEYLASMKFATLRPKDYEDLMYLLGRPGLVDLEKARGLVYRLLGGKFASDQFAAAIDEARWRWDRDHRA